jgi:hypothetical protein
VPARVGCDDAVVGGESIEIEDVPPIVVRTAEPVQEKERFSVSSFFEIEVVLVGGEGASFDRMHASSRARDRYEFGPFGSRSR